MVVVSLTEELYKRILNSHFDLIYVLDDAGNYIFANDAYLSMLRMSREELIGFNVHSFLKKGTINKCVSDEVYRTGKQVIMFQDLFLDVAGKDAPIRHIIISTPILDENGKVTNIFATMKSVEKLNDAYRQASRSEVSSIALENTDTVIPEDIVAESSVMYDVLKMIRTVADVDSAVLIQGESGTGKEVIASYLHRSSNRADKAFVTINCASLPETLLKSELFGYEKGAFTGAGATKKGLFQEADHGTLFLDEINSLPLGLQGKLLRAIETKTIQRIGASKPVKVDFRLVAATNQDLHELSEQKLFRSDLYYRLNVIPVHLPPLRERREDILPLAQEFLKIYCARFGRSLKLTPGSMEALRRYDWPGNVRELKNFIERAVILTLDDYLDIDEVSTGASSGSTDAPTLFASREHAPSQSLTPLQSPVSGDFGEMLERGVSLQDYLEQCEKAYLEYVFRQESSTYKVADMLSTSQSSVMRKKRKYGL